MNKISFELSPKTIDSIEHIFRDLLGDNFINEANKYNTLGTQNFEKIIINADTHPFYKLWQVYKQNTIQTKQEGLLRISEQIVELIDLLLNLQAIKDIKNKDRIINSIIRKNTFHSACFEASIAAGYKTSGYTIDIMEESEQKTPDLVIKTGKDKIYIECKSLEDFSIKRTSALEELMSEIEEYLFKSEKSYSVLISLGYIVDFKNKTELTNFIKDLISNNMFGIHVNYILQTKIEIIKNREWNETFYGNINLPNTYLCDGRCQVKVLPNGTTENMNLTLVAIEPFVDLNVDDRVISEFNKARKQLPKNACSIVHIQLPIKKEINFLYVIDNTYNKLQKRFENNTKRICSVVLSHVTTNLQDIQKPIVRQHFVISNNNADKELPKDFKILGNPNNFPLSSTNQDLTYFPGQRGEMKFNFNLKHTWENTPSGVMLLSYSDSTGKHQMKFWKTWSNNLRFEIINPVIGRIYTETQEINFNMQEIHEYFLEWNNDNIILKVDNEIISKYERKI